MAQPGWYSDPDGTPSRLRYFDGERWTGQTRFDRSTGDAPPLRARPAADVEDPGTDWATPAAHTATPDAPAGPLSSPARPVAPQRFRQPARPTPLPRPASTSARQQPRKSNVAGITAAVILALLVVPGIMGGLMSNVGSESQEQAPAYQCVADQIGVVTDGFVEAALPDGWEVDETSLDWADCWQRYLPGGREETGSVVAARVADWESDGTSSPRAVARQVQQWVLEGEYPGVEVAPKVLTDKAITLGGHQGWRRTIEVRPEADSGALDRNIEIVIIAGDHGLSAFVTTYWLADDEAKAAVTTMRDSLAVR